MKIAVTTVLDMAACFLPITKQPKVIITNFKLVNVER